MEMQIRDRDQNHNVGSGSEDDGDDDACSPPRSVFPNCDDCLDSQMVGTEGNVEIGKSCDVGRDRDRSHEDSSNVAGSES